MGTTSVKTITPNNYSELAGFKTRIEKLGGKFRCIKCGVIPKINEKWNVHRTGFKTGKNRGEKTSELICSNCFGRY